MAKKTSFVGQVYDYLYPKKNRVIAAVAFVRTFKQTFTGASVVGGTGLVAVNAQDIANLNWDIVLYTVIAMVLTAAIAAMTAFDDVSRNGLNSKYMDAANIPAPAVTIDQSAVASVMSKVRPSSFVPAVAPVEPVTAKKSSRKSAKQAEPALGIEQAGAVELSE